MTTTGRAHCLRRLSAATSRSDLEDVWGRFGVDAQADPEIKAGFMRLLKGFM